jgi:uncharacterized protein (UPF0371 family)
MEILTLDPLWMENSKDMVLTNGKMEASIKVNLIRARDKEEEIGNPIMEMNLMENILMISKTDGASLFGQTVKSTKDSFKMMSGMDKEPTNIQVAKWVNLCGLRVKLIIDSIQSKSSITVAATLIKRNDPIHFNLYSFQIDLEYAS